MADALKDGGKDALKDGGKDKKDGGKDALKDGGKDKKDGGKKNEKVSLINPSHIEKSGGWQFRTCDEASTNSWQHTVKETYMNMHSFQCVEYVKRKHREWGQFNHFKSTIMSALEKLNDFVDESDPDVNESNIIHAFQTAERLREAHPEKDWLHLTGLIHDLGMVMAFYGEPQWSTTGDTFVVGCEFVKSIVYRDTTFKHNPDLYNPKFNTKYGMYTPNCGLKKVYISWGHDEYLYQVLKYNQCTLPEEGLYMIRYHSFYPWHTGGDYMYLCDNRDLNMLPWIREFSKFDQDTKKEEVPQLDQLKPYYQSLIDKYCPGELSW